MLAWEEGYPLEISEEGDDVEKGFKKLMNEIAKMYGHLNIIRNLSAGAQAPADPVSFQLWIDSSVPDKPSLKMRNYKNTAWDDFTNIIFGMVQKAIPYGFIGMWSGGADNVPVGWALCDGRNGTPDLRNKFVLGAGDKYKVGLTGGEETHALTIEELPKDPSAVGYFSADSHNGKYPNGVGCVSLESRYSVSVKNGDGDDWGANYKMNLTAAFGNKPHNNMASLLCTGVYYENMSMEQYINLYNRKAKQQFYLPEDHELIVDADRGFMTYEIDGDVFYLGLVAGDGQYWNGLVQQLAQQAGCKKIMFATHRKSPAAFTRKYGYKVVGFILEKEVE